MPSCLGPTEALRQIGRIAMGPLPHLYKKLAFQFQKLTRVISCLTLAGPRIASPWFRTTKLTLKTLTFWRAMKILATRIAKELKNAKHCALYEPELSRVWPCEESREAQIASFAKKHGWRLRHYSHGFCAILDKDPSHLKAFVS